MKLAVAVTVLVSIGLVAVYRLPGAGCFRFYFTSMGQADASINPLQRALFSLLLAEMKKGQARQHGDLPHKTA